MNFYPSWKALFGKLAQDSPNLTDFNGYAHLLNFKASTAECILELTTAPHCALLTYCTGKKIKIMHHFHHDVKTPVLQAGTDELWALIGHGATALPVGLTPDLFLGCEGITPTMSEISEAASIDALKKLKPASKEQLQEHPELQYKGKKGVVLPPLLTKILMDADSEDPFILLRACCKALLDFDEASPAMVANASDAEDDDDAPILASITFFRVVQFLFFATLDKTKVYGNLDTLTTSRPRDWAVDMAAKYGVATAIGSNGSPTGVDATLGLGATLERFTAAVTKNNELQEAKAETDTKKSKTGQDKLMDFTLRMVLNASEPLPDDLEDENGDPVTARKNVVPMYERILNCSSVGMVQQQLTHYLNDEKHCCANLPLATCTAIHLGKFRWTSIDQPEAFSLLACYHLAATSTTAFQVSGEDAVSMHLRSTEGLGLNEADILKATKVVLYAPPDIDSLAKQLAVFGTLCGAIFGEKSDLQLEMDEWITHITKFEATYRNLQNSRPLFALQLACFIDRKVQLYLGGCIEAASPEEVSSAYLSFTRAKRDIMEGSFINNLVPQSLTRQLRSTSNRHTGAALDSSSSDEDAPPPSRKRRQRKGQGQKVTNDNMIKKWRVPEAAIGFFVSRLAKDGPVWGKRRICFHFHSVGECTEDCLFGNTHEEFSEKMSNAYGKWFT
jgi:hypothetical protein